MQDSVIRTLLHLNAQFYQTFAVQFSATRQRLQPGVRQIIEDLPLQAGILDLGCGNGELAAALARRGQAGRYVGLDFSPGLLASAAETIRAAQAEVKSAGQPSNLEITLLTADLADPAWEAGVPQPPYDFVLAFAVLHHLPGQSLRQATVAAAGRLLAPGGRLIFSVWQFLNSPRLAARLQPWEAAGLQPADVEAGDYLLDWRAGGAGLRYVHHFEEAELGELAVNAGFEVLDQFFSDGEGGRLGCYQIWKKT